MRQYSLQASRFYVKNGLKALPHTFNPNYGKGRDGMGKGRTGKGKGKQEMKGK